MGRIDTSPARVGLAGTEWYRLARQLMRTRREPGLGVHRVLDPPAIGNFELDRRMLHVEVIGEAGTHFIEDLSGIRARPHHDVGGATRWLLLVGVTVPLLAIVWLLGLLTIAGAVGKPL